MRKLVFSSVAMLMVGMTSDAWALSQWSRKYEVNCATCHSAFPRLNAYGDAFMQNGYQLPGSQDGGEEKMKKIDSLDLGQVGNFFGIRMSFTPVDYKSESRKEADGSMGDKLDVGKIDWIQLFVGGTVMKNVSVFTETEVLADEVEINWYHMGFHNLLDMGSYANIRIGRLSAFNWHAMTGRLRAIPPVKNEIFGYSSSNGKGDDSVKIAAPYPSVEYYGYNNSLLWAIGIQNGGKASDPNDAKNLYATLKYSLAQKGPIGGSTISIGGLTGTDTKLISTSTNAAGVVSTAAEAENKFWRVGPALNVRFGANTDFQAAYFIGNDDNWTLARPGANKVSTDFNGLSAILGQWLSPRWWGAMQYDQINSDDNTKDYEKATLSVWFFPRENLRIGMIGRYDLDKVGQDVNEATVNIRTMF